MGDPMEHQPGIFRTVSELSKYYCHHGHRALPVYAIRKIDLNQVVSWYRITCKYGQWAITEKMETWKSFSPFISLGPLGDQRKEIIRLFETGFIVITRHTFMRNFGFEEGV